MGATYVDAADLHNATPQQDNASPCFMFFLFSFLSFFLFLFVFAGTFALRLETVAKLHTVLSCDILLRNRLRHEASQQ
jgi:hypothetical protein